MFSFLAEQAGLELAVLASQLFVFGFQLGDAHQSRGMHRLPVAGLLPQLKILPPQIGHFLPQRDDFPHQILD